MKRFAHRHLLAAALLALGAATASAQTPAPVAPVAAPASVAPTVSHGLFSNVQLFRPAGVPQQFVMLVSGNDSPNATERQMVKKMTDAGAMVAVIPLAPFYKKLEAQDGKCTFAAGAFENLSRYLQAFEKLPTYLVPMLVGSGSTAPFAYALLAQAPNGTFASAMSVGFCPRLALKTPMCVANALRWQAGSGPGSSLADGGMDLQPSTTALSSPWTALQGGAEAACTPAAAQGFVQRVPQAVWLPASPAASATDVPSGFEAAYASLAVPQVPLGPPPAQLADVPIVELPVAEVPAGNNGRRFAVLLSGDGGWAGIDKGIAASLVAKGVPVAGFDSLRYFWSARTPEGLATDLDRVVRYYAARWKRSEVILIGYSQGADVLPFAVNRLPAATRNRVRLTALLGLGQKASFEFHVTNWIGPSGDKPIAPEARKLSAARTICIHGQAEQDSLCPSLAPAHARPIALTGGHHFGGDYDALAAHILDAAGR
jgi:type IV secretory pathway VirJ component